MKDINNQSYRGGLVRFTIETIIENNPDEPLEKFKESLEEKLRLNLRFPTRVTDLEITDEFTHGQVHYEDSNGAVVSADFAIENQEVET